VTAAFQTTTPSPEVEAERRAAFRALLRDPLLLATGDTAEKYILVRRHSAWLKQWITKFPAWSLHIDDDLARLRKLPSDVIDETRQAVDRASGTAFSRRRYALLCLALAALEQSDRQTTLAQIAQRIMEFTASDQHASRDGTVFDIENYDLRRDLVHAVRLLMDTGVLARVDGDERQFLNRSGSPDVLFEINRSVLAVVLNVSSGASAIEKSEFVTEMPVAQRATRLIQETMPNHDDPRSLRIRSRLVRILLDDPVLYFHDLDDEERLYLDHHRSYLLRQISEATGLRAEVRREGIAMVDDDGELTDIKLPEEGTDGHLSLLLVQWLAEHSKNRVDAAIPMPLVEEYVAHLIRVHGSQWHEEVCQSGSEAHVTGGILLRLRALRLVQLRASEVIPLPACGRYAVCDSINSVVHEE
jgi:uncharacterized protein (TIGR02678 family)